MVYLVDDEQEIHDFFTQMFKNIRAFELQAYYSGTEALLAIGQEPPKIIIVDILMPDFDGTQVIRNIKENAKLQDVNIIAISGDSTKKDEALSAGQGDDGNQFVYTGSHWQLNLKTKNYSASGTYTVTIISGDEDEYTIDPTCEATFVIQ